MIFNFDFTVILPDRNMAEKLAEELLDKIIQMVVAGGGEIAGGFIEEEDNDEEDNDGEE